MTALILNAGMGKRMGSLTKHRCKCMLEIAEGATVLSEQIRRLNQCGVRDFFIMTGPFAGDLRAYAEHTARSFPRVRLTFIHNPLYRSTNYIYSLYLAKDELRGDRLQDDLLLLHGDLVFDTSVAEDIIHSPHSVMTVNTATPLSAKDFKAVVKEGKIIRVGVDVFEHAVNAQPMYKLLRREWTAWLREIEHFCRKGMTRVYAEEALNRVCGQVNLFPMDVYKRVCMEIDNRNDFDTVRYLYEANAF